MRRVCVSSGRLDRAVSRISALCALSLLGSLVFVASPQAAGPERVTIPALHPDGVALTGFLLRPSGAGVRAPAVVLMHGCGGPVTPSGRIRPRERAWMERLAQTGYASLLVDSFNPRGVRSTCGTPTKGLSAEEDRPYDAYAALRWLDARGDIDGDRIALLGWSHGGASVLSAAAKENVERLGGGAGPFRLVVAFYPGCRALARTDYRAGLPLLVHLGEADDWTPVRFCQALARKVRADGGAIRTFLYAGAHHGFDLPSGEVRERRLPSGRVVHSGPDPEARDLAISRTLEALAVALARGRR
jgi:dienelactone hydrolase